MNWSTDLIEIFHFITKFVISGQVPIKNSLPDLTLLTPQAQNPTTAVWGLKISQLPDAKQHFPIHCNPYRRSESTKFSLLSYSQLHGELGISHSSFLTHHSHSSSRGSRTSSTAPARTAWEMFHRLLNHSNNSNTCLWDILHYSNSNWMQNNTCSGNSQFKCSSYVIFK